MNKKSARRSLCNMTSAVFAAGALLGLILFCAVYGVKIINPCFDDWLMMDRDTTQHYIGWLYYRSSPWHFPIGLMDGISAPYRVSVIYSDSIPLLAVPFKLLSPILPKTFQYFGLYGLISYGLMGGFSSLLLYRLTKRPLGSTAFSALFTLSPYILHRMFIHTALAGHWVILAAIYLWFSNVSRPSRVGDFCPEGSGDFCPSRAGDAFARLKHANRPTALSGNSDVSRPERPDDAFARLKHANRAPVLSGNSDVSRPSGPDNAFARLKHANRPPVLSGHIKHTTPTDSIAHSDRAIKWCILLFVTSGIHLYLVAIVYIFCFLDALETWIVTRKFKQPLITLALSFIIVIANLALLGAFYGGVAAGAGGFGVFGATLLTFFDAGNPDFSGRLLPNLPEGMYQFEGYGYLGCGILLLCLICIIFRLIKKVPFSAACESRLRFRIALIAAAFFFFWAIFPNITLGENIGEPGVHNLFSFWMPEIIYNLLSILRCNGRFIWPCCYLIYIGAITYFLRCIAVSPAKAPASPLETVSPAEASSARPLRRALPALVSALVIGLQLFDLSAGIYNLHNSIFFTGEYTPWYKVSGGAWDELLATRPHVVYMKFHIERGTRLGYALARKALEAGGDINTFYLARDLKEETEAAIAGYEAELAAGSPRSDVIYIFPEDANIPGEYGLFLYRMDGVIVGIADDEPDILEFKGVWPYISEE